MLRRILLPLFALVWLALPVSAVAQSAIAGVVKDTSGAVLPGVTVEASSPALIEKSRTVVTDAQGQYKVVDLRPGTYSVTFTLPGFSTVKRDGIELTSDFTASVNVDMRVGGVEETITVSGGSPVVDVQTTERRDVLTRDVLDVLPTGRNYQTIGSTLPGVNMGRFDVGGSTAMQQTQVMTNGSLGGDMALLLDGMNIQSSLTSGSTPAVYHNDDAYQEYVFQVSGGTAESQSGGVVINMIPKEGSNSVKGDGLAVYSNGNFQSSNVSADQRAHGVTLPPQLDKTRDYAGSVGFPIREDRLWWFSSFRVWGYNNFAPNAMNPDGSRAVDDNLIQAYTNRATLQISPKNKFTAMYDKLPKFRGHRNIENGLTDPKASVVQRTPLAYNAQAKWTSTVTSRMLLEAGFSEQYYNYTLHYEPEVKVPAQNPPFGDVSMLELVNPANRLSNAAQMDFQDWFPSYNVAGSASYVTGSHAIKTGVQYQRGWIKHYRDSNGDMVQRYRNGAPDSVIRWNFPITLAESDLDRGVGVYVQDSWTFRKLTLNPGLRYEILQGSVPAQSAPAGRFVPARSFAAIPNLPNFKNWAPRLGVAYDLSGNGKTAIKFAVGRYMQQEATGFADKYNPLVQGSDIVTWTDLNHDNIAQDNELGAANNATLGVRRNINPDPNLARPYQILYNLGVQHQLFTGISVSANYYRREYHHLVYTTNLDVPLSVYTLVNISDPRGNGATLPVYNLLPAYLGKVNEFDTTSPNNKRTYNGFDVLVNGRGRGGATLSGGINVGHTVSILCDVEDPNALRFCDQTQYTIPLSTTVKLNGSYPLPFGVRLSGVFQSADGFGLATAPVNTPTANPDNHDVMATYQVTRAVVPTLAQTQVNVLLDPPGSNWMPRVTQLDFSLSKTIRARSSLVLTPQVDIFNTLNANTLLTEVTTFGPSVGNPSTILTGRLIRFQVRARF
jgi:carboxypeptidase family protein